MVRRRRKGGWGGQGEAHEDPRIAVGKWHRQTRVILIHGYKKKKKKRGRGRAAKAIKLPC